MAFIFITKSDGTQNKYRLPNTADVRVDIGRNDECLISLPDVQGISGLHCSIAFMNGYYILKDEGSSNGTILDGASIQEVVLEENRSYGIGDAALSFYAEAAAPAAAPEPAQAAPAAAPKAAPRTAGANQALKRSAKAKVRKIQVGKYSEEGLSPIYVIVVILIAFAAGLTIRHWKETGTFLPQDLFAAKPAAEAPATPADKSTKK